MRVPSDIESIKGTFKSETDGAFVFLFDNSFSWFNSKLLSYTVNLFQVRATLPPYYNATHVRPLTLFSSFWCILHIAGIHIGRSEPCTPKPPPAPGYDGRHTQS